MGAFKGVGRGDRGGHNRQYDQGSRPASGKAKIFQHHVFRARRQHLAQKTRQKILYGLSPGFHKHGGGGSQQREKRQEGGGRPPFPHTNQAIFNGGEKRPLHQPRRSAANQAHR